MKEYVKSKQFVIILLIFFVGFVYGFMKMRYDPPYRTIVGNQFVEMTCKTNDGKWCFYEDLNSECSHRCDKKSETRPYYRSIFWESTFAGISTGIGLLIVFVVINSVRSGL